MRSQSDEVRALKRRVCELEDIIDTLREPILILDGNLEIHQVNRAFHDTFRTTPSETVGARLWDMAGGQWRIPRLRALLEEILQEDSHLADFEVSADFPGLGPRVMLLNARRIERRDAAATTILLAIEDITVRRAAEEALAKVALTDKLTGLYNRRGLYALAGSLIERLRREELPVHLLFADLDQLKTINDRFGHAEGDRALVATAKVLRDTFRDSDIVARYGGDEFLVVLVGATGEEVLGIRARVEKAFATHASASPYPLSLSVGVVRSELGPDFTLEDLITQADTAMYQEKRRRRSAARRT